jgi:chromosome segregation ATPase
MLEGKRRVNKNKLNKANDISISNLDIANLKIQKELLNRENTELSASLDAKRKSLGLDYKSCQKIEKEHFDKVNKLRNEYLDLVSLYDSKSLELMRVNESVCSLRGSIQCLTADIESLNKDKEKLAIEIEETTYNNNVDKKNSETYLSNLRELIASLNNEYLDISNKLLIAKQELSKTLESTQLENKLIARRQKDIDIYEARFRGKYPNKTVILAK